MKMKNIAMKIITIMLVFTVMTPFMAGTAFAATSVTVSGQDEVAVGDEFTVKIEFTGDNTARVDGQIGFDSSKLEYVSGAEDGGEGYVILKKGGGEDSVVFDVTFKAIKGGKTGLDVSSSEIYDNNKNLIDNCAETKIIHITGDASSNDENVVEDEGPMPQEEEYNENQRAKKWAMTIAGGVMCLLVFAIVFVVYRKINKRKAKKLEQKNKEGQE